jgi:hypothetical protein
MKDTVVKKTEFLANLCVISIAVLAGVVLIKDHIFDRPIRAESRRSAPPPGPAVGTRIALPGVNWADKDNTLLVVLSKNCRFCSESAPFYQKIAREADQNEGVRLIAVFPQDAGEGRKYLSELGVPIEEVIQSPLEVIGARGTPTLILVDKEGVVKNTWAGRLNSDKEPDVLGRLKCDTCN